MQALVKRRCQADPWAFFALIQTFDRFGAIRTIPTLPYIGSMVADLHGNTLNLWLKSRQMMATWVVAAYFLWAILFRERIHVLFIGKKQEESTMFGERLKFMHEHLPGFLKQKVAIQNTTTYKLGNGSTAKFLPSSEDAGRSHQAMLVAIDEFAWQDHARAIWTAVRPAFQGGGRGVLLSSPSGTQGKFYELWQEGESLNFNRRVIHYTQDPAKDQAWAAEERKGLSDGEWRQEYECEFVGFAGRVYSEFRRDVHLCDMPALHSAGRFYGGIDFGHTNPFVFLLVYSPPPDYDTYYVLGEHYKRNWLHSQHASAILELVRKPPGANLDMHRNGIHFEFGGSVLADPEDAQARVELNQILTAKGASFKIRAASKPAGSVKRGIEMVKRLLMPDAKTGKPKLFVVKDNCPNVCLEFENYRWREDKPGKNSDERPHPENDHSMDALRYIIYSINSREPSEGSTDFTW